MKTLLPLLSLNFFLMLFSLAKGKFPHVGGLLDEDGDMLKNGRSYYILPASKGHGGGLQLAMTKGETCPLTVVQAPSDSSWGLPVSLWTPPRIAFLSTNFYLHVGFRLKDPPPCLRDYSGIQWKIDGEEESQEVVKIAPSEEEYEYGRFKIQPYRKHYKLVYCVDDDECKDLGISVDDENNRRLVVKDGEPLEVKFVRRAKYHEIMSFDGSLSFGNRRGLFI